MKNILLFISIFFFQISFSQVITFECNNSIITVSWDEIVNNPNAYMDWDADGDIDEDDVTMYLYEAYDCENSLGGCQEYTTIVIDCVCLDNQEIIFLEEIDESNCEITQICECIPVNNDINWNNIDWEDLDWEDFDWESVWSDYDLGNIIDWDDTPWDDINKLEIDPDDLIIYIQNMSLGQSFDWDEFVVSMQGGEDCCINPEWIDPMAACPFIYDPVIGCDGLEYSNSCVAEAAGVTSYVDSVGNETILEWNCICVQDPISLDYTLEMPICEGEPAIFTANFVNGGGCGGYYLIMLNGFQVEIGIPTSINAYSGDQIDILVSCMPWDIMPVGGEICAESYVEEIILLNSCEGDDCVDDPEGILAQYGYQCNDIVGEWFSWECTDDLSVAVPESTSGIWTIGDLCSLSCNECDDELDCVAELIPDCVFMTVVDPVCGCDGVTYSNSGEAACNNIFDFTMGECESVVDCIDDPDGMVTQFGSSCSELAILGCDADLSDFIPGIGFGISVYEICPESCGDCGEGTVGCTDIEACNYNPDATEDDGSCDYGVECFVSPCSTSPSPFSGATCVDDYCGGCCAIWTWTNEQGYDFTFNSCTDEYTEGCTESNAINYNPDAILDDGSCEYAWDDCSSQQILESFGNFNLGNIDSQSSDWFGWDNGNSGVDVVNFSMNTYLGDGQSIFVEQDDDLIWDLDGINTGSGEVIFYMYIPSSDDAGAYYNMLHNYAAANSNWAFEVFFASASSGDQSYINLDQLVYFDAIYDTWVEVRHEIDIDNDLITLYYNGEMISSWAWSNGSAGASSVLDALNLFGFCTGTPCSGFTYYDNIEICGDFYNNVNIEEELNLDISLYPNPNKGSFNIVLNEDQVEFNIRVFNILGKEVYNELIDGYVKNSVKTIDLTLIKGTYIVNLETKNHVIKIPIIIE